MALLEQSEQISNCKMSGNKSARLAQLASAGFRVPPFFVIATEVGVDSLAADDRGDLERHVASALRRLNPDGAAVAVRSSSVEEDGALQSFAGQFDSYLNVQHCDVFARIADVQRSADSEHIRHYRESNALDGTACVPAVMVQAMVPADAAGVAFAADPVTGDSEVAVVAAQAGLGDVLVNGECQGDTWRVDMKGKVIDRDLSDEGAPVLGLRQVRSVTQLVRDVSKRIGKPQDIEWAIWRGRIYLLQSRDITSLPQAAKDACWALWDNSNIVESYGGVTTPLTFSVARSAYAEAYKHFGRVIGVGERTIESNERTYAQMIGLIDGRVYYNLINWYRLLMQTPGFRFNKRFMEQMMGVTRAVPDSALPRVDDSARFAAARALLGMLKVGGRLLRKHLWHRRRVEQFHRRISELLLPVPIEDYSLQRLIDYYDLLQAEVIPAWDTPLLNDLYCMIFHGTLRKLCESWLPDALAEAHNDLASGEAGIISLEPVRRMRRMADIASADRDLKKLLTKASAAEIEQHLAACPEFQQEYHEYLQRFGDRCMDELKLESQTLKDDPLPMLRAVGQMASTKKRLGNSAGPTALRATVERRIADCMRGQPIRYAVFRIVLRLTRGRIRDRENLRFERTRVYGRVRAIFVEIGRRLRQAGVLRQADDIFYLDVNEVAGFIRGTGSSAALGAVALARRKEFADYRAIDDPPRRFLTSGPAQLPQSRQPSEVEDSAQGLQMRSGQACSPGIVRGPVRIVKDPRTANVAAGDILVAERTDPGWVMIFPLVAAMIMERGSLLSHSAIVARELGLPCVVGVEDACRWLQDGEWVEINGASGTVRRLAADEEAA